MGSKTVLTMEERRMQAWMRLVAVVVLGVIFIQIIYYGGNLLPRKKRLISETLTETTSEGGVLGSEFRKKMLREWK